jgi:hypothetical protein
LIEQQINSKKSLYFSVFYSEEETLKLNFEPN